MGRPVTHFEVAVRDLNRAASFYEELFGWTVEDERMEGYRLVRTTDDGIGGGLLKLPELGGKVVVEPMPIPGAGSFAMFQDPDGVMMGLFQEHEQG